MKKGYSLCEKCKCEYETRYAHKCDTVMIKILASRSVPRPDPARQNEL